MDHKPTLEDLMNQIYEWREKTWVELRRAEELEARKKIAQQEVLSLFA